MNQPLETTRSIAARTAAASSCGAGALNGIRALVHAPAARDARST
jgi:hypothetical protein